MRVRVVVACALACVAIVTLASAPASSQAECGPEKKFSRTWFFDGGSLTCTSCTIRAFSESIPKRAKKKNATDKTEKKQAKKAPPKQMSKTRIAFANVVNQNNQMHRYQMTTISHVVRRRALNNSGKEFGFTAWDFTCTVWPDENVAHSCDMNIQSPTGSCTVCASDGCKHVSFNVKRTASRK